MIKSEIVLGLPDYEITDLQISGGGVRISARHNGLKSCPHCGSERLRNKGRYPRLVRHENW
ncbi:MAG: transposase family protein, partial [Acidobacteriia bacterium]|nr:transposase family protein [Terriglobia bacterium]